MTNEIISVILKWFIPFLCCATVTYLTSKIGRSKALENGVKSLLRSEIIRAYEKYTEKKYCPIYAREPLTKVYESYHALGGNGTGTDLYQKTILLPCDKPKEDAQ